MNNEQFVISILNQNNYLKRLLHELNIKLQNNILQSNNIFELQMENYSKLAKENDEFMIKITEKNREFFNYKQATDTTIQKLVSETKRLESQIADMKIAHTTSIKLIDFENEECIEVLKKEIEKLKKQLHSGKNKTKLDISKQATKDITAKLTTQLTKQLKEELTKQLKEELTAQLKEALTVKLTEELTADLTSQIIFDLTTEITSKLKAKLTAELTSELTAELTAKLTGELTAELTAKLTEELTSKLTAELTTELTAKCSKELKKKEQEFETNIEYIKSKMNNMHYLFEQEKKELLKITQDKSHIISELESQIETYKSKFDIKSHDSFESIKIKLSELEHILYTNKTAIANKDIIKTLHNLLKINKELRESNDKFISLYEQEYKINKELFESNEILRAENIRYYNLAFHYYYYFKDGMRDGMSQTIFYNPIQINH